MASKAGQSFSEEIKFLCQILLNFMAKIPGLFFQNFLTIPRKIPSPTPCKLIAINIKRFWKIINLSAVRIDFKSCLSLFLSNHVFSDNVGYFNITGNTIVTTMNTYIERIRIQTRLPPPSISYCNVCWLEPSSSLPEWPRHSGISNLLRVTNVPECRTRDGKFNKH